MKLSLIENGLDFVLSAVENAKDGDDRGLKYSVLHVSDGVELILKERLRRKNWKLLFADPEKASEAALKSGDFPSVSFNICIKRLKKETTVNIEPYIPLLNLLRNLRNKFQHFEFEESREAIIPVVVSAWSFIYDFLHDELSDTIEANQTTIEKIKTGMMENETFIENRLSEIQPELEKLEKKSALILECPRCLQPSLIVQGGEDPYCLFCRYADIPENAVVEWYSQFVSAYDPEDWSIDYPLKTCFECGAETLVCSYESGSQALEHDWVCFSCGNSWSLKEVGHCSECGNPYQKSEDSVGFCDDCWDYKMNNDNT